MRPPLRPHRAPSCALLPRQRRRGCGPPFSLKPGLTRTPLTPKQGSVTCKGSARTTGPRARGVHVQGGRAQRGRAQGEEVWRTRVARGEEEVCVGTEGRRRVRGRSEAVAAYPRVPSKECAGAGVTRAGGCTETEGRTHPFRALAPVDRQTKCDVLPFDE